MTMHVFTSSSEHRRGVKPSELDFGFKFEVYDKVHPWRIEDMHDTLKVRNKRVFLHQRILIC